MTDGHTTLAPLLRQQTDMLIERRDRMLEDFEKRCVEHIRMGEELKQDPARMQEINAAIDWLELQMSYLEDST